MRLLLVTFFLTTQAYAHTPSYELRFTDAIDKALQHSEQLKSVSSDIQASQEQALTLKTALVPRLSLDGSLRYLSEVPSLQASPQAPPVSLGSHLNYSIGPTLSYLLWDGNSVRNNYKSQMKRRDSQREGLNVQTAQLIASVKLAYMRTQLGLEQLKMLADSVKLAESQSQDIANRKKEGAASELDSVTAKNEVLNYKLLFKQKQNELASFLRDLLAFVEEDSHKIPAQDPAPEGFANASLWLKLDSLDSIVKKESQDEAVSIDASIPLLRSMDLQVEALELQARSQEGSLYPQIKISARTSLDYPDGPVIKKFNQNTLSIDFTMPLYEFSKTQHLVAEKNFEAEALKHRRNQMQQDIFRDFAKAKESLRSLRQQDLDAQVLLKQRETLAKLNYEAYKFGRLNLVEVQAANLHALQAKVNILQIRAQIFNQLILLKTLLAKDLSS